MTHQIDLSSISRSVTYTLWSSDFASCLEDYLLEKICTWDVRSVSLRDWPCKLYMGQWLIFYGPLILPYNIVIDLKVAAGCIRDPLGTCSSCWKNVSSFCKCYWHFFSKNISVYAVFNDQSFNDTLTYDIVSFEQLGPDSCLLSRAMLDVGCWWKPVWEYTTTSL